MYLATSADHAWSLPLRHARTRRASLHVMLGRRNRRARRGVRVSPRRTRGPPAPEQFLDVPQRVMVEDRGPEVAQPLRHADENAGTGKADDGQILRDQLLH